MPELPEVETTLQGIKPHIDQQEIKKVIIRQPKLRWPIPRQLNTLISGKIIGNSWRRGKYIILDFAHGHLLLHLGMSGKMRILETSEPAQKHDHVDFILANNKLLRFTDPRRFGAVLWTADNINQHDLLKHLGPEPLEKSFTANYLYDLSRNRSAAIKTFIMDGKIVVGVGNIYATEALFLSHIHPLRPASDVTLKEYQTLVSEIKKILRKAIKIGGTTLRDFTKSDGSPGYFYQQLNAYGKAGHPCPGCDETLDVIKVGQRSSVFCPKCQR